ncbi:hypothetical protein [Chlorella virus XW01]|nr:hypothetical protein [Chlorella virus XW01]
MSKFRKPRIITDQTYVVEINYDTSKIAKLFTEAENLNIYNLKKISLTDKIPLDVSIEDGSNLIHHILKKPSNSQNQKINLMKYLVDNNVNPDKPDINNNTPLHLACQNQEDEIIKYLLDIGCNPNFKNNFGMTPMHYYLTGIYRERILEKDFLSIVKIKEPLDLEQTDLDASLNQLFINDNEIQSLKKTINGLLNDNNLIKKLDKIKVDNKFDLLQVKGFLEKYIDSFLKNIFNFENLEIHEKTPSSLDTFHPSLSVLKNTNISNILKDNIKKAIKEIKKLLIPNIIVPDLSEMHINQHFYIYKVNDDFIRNDNQIEDEDDINRFYVHNNKFLLFSNIPTNNHTILNIINDRVNYLQQLNPSIERNYIMNQCNKLTYLQLIYLINTGNNIDDFKNKLKMWLFVLMDEGIDRDLIDVYDNIKNINQEVILMNKLIDNYVNGGFTYDDRVKILEKLVEQKKTRVFFNDLLFTDTLFILKKVNTVDLLNYYLSVMGDINNLDPTHTLYDFDKLLPSINPKLILNRTPENIRIHNYAYFFNFYIISFDYLGGNNIENRLDFILRNHLKINNAINILKNKFSEMGIKDYHKIAPLYLSALSWLNYHYLKIIEFLGEHIDTSETKILSVEMLNEVVDKMNYINCNYLVYYYFFTNNKTVKIPKFYLYKIPTSYSRDNFEFTGNIVYNDTTDLLNLNNFGSNVLYDNLPISNHRGYVINSLYNYPDVEDIYLLNIPYVEINESYRFNKDNILPQSMWNNNYLKIFMDIYFIEKYKKIIQDVRLQNLVKYKNTIAYSEKEILDKYTIGQKLKELIINNINRYSNDIINNKLSNLIGNIGIAIPDSDVKSNYRINLNDIKLKYRIITDLLYYEYDLTVPKEKHFLIYSDDYSSIQVEKTLLESKINENGLKHLIEYGASISIEDNYGKNPIENIIKNLNVDVYKNLLDLLKFNVDLTTFNNKKILDYFTSALNSEIDKYLDMDIKSSIIKFSVDQGNDIDMKVKTLSPQLNNKNYLLSFKIINYISNQLIGVLNITKGNNNSFNTLLNITNNINSLFLNNVRGFSNNNYLLLNNLRNKLSNEYTKLIENRRKLQSLGKSTDSIDIKLAELFRIINGIPVFTKSTTYFYNIRNIDLNFIDNYGRNDNLVELEMFNDLFTSNLFNLNDDKLVILPKVLMKEKEYLSNLNVENWRNYKVLIEFYDKLAIEVEKYFTDNQFRINNEIKEFVFKVLVYLTKTVIISQIELLIKKVLTEYFDNTYPDSAPNIQRTDGILHYNTFTGNNNNNKDKLYNLAEIMVINSVFIYKDNNEKDTFLEKSIENILEEWLLEMLKSSAINIDENDEFISKLKIQLNNFGFIKNIINNWLVVIENNFKFIINHSRILKMLELTINT